MKILLISGCSGVGKSYIASKLKEYNNFNFIQSFTDRPRRLSLEDDHSFISKILMDLLLTYDVAASTDIDGYRYCATFRQFDSEKINIYIVDKKGIDDIRQNFKDAQIFSVLITNDNINIDQSRKDRIITIPTTEEVDFVLKNDETIEVVELLKNKAYDYFGVDYV